MAKSRFKQLSRLVFLCILALGIYIVSQEKYIPDLAPRVLIPLSGTGSMYPTFPKGIGKTDLERSKEISTSIPMYPFSAAPSVFTKLLSKNSLTRGDIVDFENTKTREITLKQYNHTSGLVKRVIALPGDTIEIRDGYILLNTSPLPEAYIAQPHSTFGGEFLPECQLLHIPENHLFVMGDNRKGSSDSRHEVGLVAFSDIKYILPLEDQSGKYDSTWRDTSNDFDPDTKIHLDKQAYIRLLNAKRLEAGTKPLTENSLLSTAAKFRGEVMLKFNDFSYEATRSGLTQTQSMSKAGYWNPIRGETWQIGYYSAEELIENQFEFPDSKKFLLDPQFQDIGIWETQGKLNGCPTQVIVQHFAGYVPPNYQQDVVDSWRQALEGLKQIQPGWATLKNSGDFYTNNKPSVDRINDIIHIRITRLTVIVSKMASNEWLSTIENHWVDEDATLASELSSLAQSLNKR